MKGLWYGFLLVLVAWDRTMAGYQDDEDAEES
jgi:hypothetical protein